MQKEMSMKLKSILAAGLLMSALAAADAHATPVCTLTVNPGSFIPLGWAFSYHIEALDFGPWPPGQFTIKFFGTKNGVVDTPSDGEIYPRTFPLAIMDLTGYLNPATGGFTGDYTRVAVLFDPNGNVYCVTNQVSLTLQ